MTTTSKPFKDIDPIAREFAARVRQELADHVKKIILFGSRARGDAWEGSDYDFLVVVDQVTKDVRKILQEINSTILDKYDQMVSYIVWTEEEWAFKKGFPVGLNIVKEGIELFAFKDELQVYRQPATTEEVTGSLLAKSRNKLEGVRTITKLGHWNDLSRDIYFGIFHAISAVLFSDRQHFSRHDQLLDAFKKKLVQTSAFHGSFGVIIDRLFETYQKSESDIWFEPNRESVKQDLNDAEMIVKECETYLNKVLP